jgi:hypothetical protein
VYAAVVIAGMTRSYKTADDTTCRSAPWARFPNVGCTSPFTDADKALNLSRTDSPDRQALMSGQTRIESSSCTHKVVGTGGGGYSGDNYDLADAAQVAGVNVIIEVFARDELLQ